MKILKGKDWEKLNVLVSWTEKRINELQDTVNRLELLAEGQYKITTYHGPSLYGVPFLANLKVTTTDWELWAKIARLKSVKKQEMKNGKVYFTVECEEGGLFDYVATADGIFEI